MLFAIRRPLQTMQPPPATLSLALQNTTTTVPEFEWESANESSGESSRVHEHDGLLYFLFFVFLLCASVLFVSFALRFVVFPLMVKKLTSRIHPPAPHASRDSNYPLPQ